MKTSRKELAFVAACLLAGLFLRALHLMDYSSLPVFGLAIGPDVSEYEEWAKRILAGELLWKEANIHAPLYPYFLAALFKLSSCGFLWTRLAQLTLNLLAGLPFFFVLRDNLRESDSKLRFVPHVFLATWAVYPPAIYYQGELLSESLLTPLLACATLLLHLAQRRKDMNSAFAAAGAGLFAGLALITHPLSIFFAGLAAAFLALPPLAAWAKARSMKLKPLLPAAAFCLAAALPVIPVSAYNTAISGHLVFIQKNSGFNFYLGNNPSANGLCNVFPGPEWQAVHAEAERESSKLGIAKDSYFLRKSEEFIAKHPLQWLSLCARKALYALNFRETSALTEDVSRLKLLFIHRNLWSCFSPLAVLGLTGLLYGLFDPRFRKAFVLFGILFAGFWIGQTLFVSSGRYRLAMLPAFAAFASYALCVVPELGASRRKAMLFSAALLISAAAALIPRPPVDEKRELAQAESIYGEACLKAGRPDEALGHLLNSLSGLSHWDRTYNLLGQAMLEMGQRTEARELFRKATDVAPNSPHGYMNLGVLSSEEGDFASAGRFFANALELNPRSSETLFNIAFMEQRRGNADKAAELYKECLDIDPVHRRALNNYGALLLAKGDASAAIALFRKAALLEPSNPKLLLNLAIAQLDAGRKDDALSSARKALRLAPDMEQAKVIVRKIEESR